MCFSNSRQFALPGILRRGHQKNETLVQRFIHKTHTAVLAALLLVISGAAVVVASEKQVFHKVVVIPVSGEIEPGIAAFLKRALMEVPDTPDTLIVVEMNTFGGRVDSALEMVESLIQIKQARTIAYVSDKAISAGALISLACNQLVMKHHTTIGDCAPITYSKEGPQMMGEKFQSPLRAKFRTLAKRNGYPPALAEAMVTADMEIYRVKIDGRVEYIDGLEYEELSKRDKARISEKRTVVAKGELLTMDDSEAHELGFSSMSVGGIDEMLAKMGVTGYALQRIEESWSENLVSLMVAISPILMLIGLGALYLEIKSPGFGVPGIVGILCLALVFFNQYLVGLADYTELLILITGIILLGFEMFVIPGFGIAGIAGIICITAALLLGFQDFVIPDPRLPWQKELLVDNLLKVTASVVGAFVAALAVLRYVFPRISRAVHGPYLSATLADARFDLPAEETGIQAGRTGTAVTLLRPSGKAKIDGVVYDVVSQADFIPKGSRIRVLKISGTRIIVVREEFDIGAGSDE
jgi:membrane-bound serine protease (ClpP class)